MSEKIVPLSEQKLPENCVVFKHSTRCPISTAAAAEVRSFDWPLPVYWVNVIEQRPISNWIAEMYDVKHASPQLIHLVDGKPRTVLTHSDIHAGAFTALS